MTDRPALYLGAWQQALVGVGPVDALLSDPPYSDRTHVGHCAGVGLAVGGGPTTRRDLGYAAWGQAAVDAFCDSWCPRVRGWMVLACDDVLAPLWAEALRRHGRNVFAPIPFVQLGGRVRLAGDGPSCWAVWLIVSRPRTKAWLDQWRKDRKALGFPCALPGAYVLPEGQGEKGNPVVGSKPLWLGEQLVRDYSLPGQLVVDPCAGSGTFLRAADLLGRRAVGAEVDPDTHRVAAYRLAQPLQQQLLGVA